MPGPRRRIDSGAQGGSGGGGGPAPTGDFVVGPDYGERAGNDDTTHYVDVALDLDGIAVEGNLAADAALDLDDIAGEGNLVSDVVLDLDDIAGEGNITAGVAIALDDVAGEGSVSASTVIDLDGVAGEGNIVSGVAVDLDDIAVEGSLAASAAIDLDDIAGEGNLATDVAVDLDDIAGEGNLVVDVVYDLDDVAVEGNIASQAGFSTIRFGVSNMLATEDTWIPKGTTLGSCNDDTNKDGTDLQIAETLTGTDTTQQETWIKFGTDAFDAAGTDVYVYDARLTLNLKTSAAGTGSIADLGFIAEGAESWSESTLTCSNAPTVTEFTSGGEYLSVAIGDTTGVDRTYHLPTDVCDYIANRITNGATTTLVLSGNIDAVPNTTPVVFESKDEGTNDASGPRLEFKFEVVTAENVEGSIELDDAYPIHEQTTPIDGNGMVAHPTNPNLAFAINDSEQVISFELTDLDPPTYTIRDTLATGGSTFDSSYPPVITDDGNYLVILDLQVVGTNDEVMTVDVSDPTNMSVADTAGLGNADVVGYARGFDGTFLGNIRNPAASNNAFSYKDLSDPENIPAGNTTISFGSNVAIEVPHVFEMDGTYAYIGTTLGGLFIFEYGATNVLRTTNFAAGAGGIFATYIDPTDADTLLVVGETAMVSIDVTDRSSVSVIDTFTWPSGFTITAGISRVPILRHPFLWVSDSSSSVDQFGSGPGVIVVDISDTTAMVQAFFYEVNDFTTGTGSSSQNIIIGNFIFNGSVTWKS